ncbi:serine hydrolase [Clostridium sp. 19966]|uniref:serine hydrolase n=1 Tax=Clostridium sp. 19966 TaxID=2768166 RepID=UPI0028E00DA9|nr:serine hydrolase [Clostridium sp. 19966]MDT8719610.1 serine hydrolase [Clostridium sp. 19966]
MLRHIILDFMKQKKVKYSIYFKDLKSGCQCSIDEKVVVPSASIIKLFIMAKAFETCNSGRWKLNDKVTVEGKNRVPYSIVYLLDESNSYTILDLITLMIVQSDNSATNKLIDMLGMGDINDYISQLGFKDTLLQRKMMDMDAKEKGLENYTSAQDVGKFLKMLYDGQIINKHYSDMMLDIMKEQLDSSMMRIDIPDDIVVAHKTGDLTNIKHDAGIVFTDKESYIFVMLTWDALSDNYARNAIGSVSKLVYNYVDNMGEK